MNKKFSLRPVIIAILFLSTGASSASIITLAGEDVSFSFDDSLIEIFGMPRVSGNSIRFKPIDLNAASFNGIGDVVDQFSISMLITPNEGVTLSSIVMREVGAYAISHEGGSVNYNGIIQVSDESDPLGIIDTASISTNSDFDNYQGVPSDWTARSTVDLSASMWDDTSVFVISIGNMLGAMTNDSISKAFIGINRLGIRVNVDDSIAVTAVPIPASIWLFGSGLVGLVAVSRRRLNA